MELEQGPFVALRASRLTVARRGRTWERPHVYCLTALFQEGEHSASKRKAEDDGESSPKKAKKYVISDEEEEDDDDE